MDGGMLGMMGGEEGCRRLATAFYGRVGKDPALRPLFPGKSLRCATEEFGAFLIQFLGGDEGQTQYRWWLSLRESHGRFRIGAAERAAWLQHMRAALEDMGWEAEVRQALGRLFTHSSSYVTGRAAEGSVEGELAARWAEQRALDDLVAAIAEGRDEDVLRWAPRFAGRPSVYLGILARMTQTRRVGLIEFVTGAVKGDGSLGGRCFGGRTLLHFAAGAGCLEVVTALLGGGMDANVQDRGGHPPLYAAANECAGESGAAVVRTLVRAGADVNAQGGVTRATPLHMTARRGHVEAARALLEASAAVNLRDSKGDTPLQRAINCRRREVAELIAQWGGRR